MTEDDGTGAHLGNNSRNDDDGYESIDDQKNWPAEEKTAEHGASPTKASALTISKPAASEKPEKWPGDPGGSGRFCC